MFKDRALYIVQLQYVVGILCLIFSLVANATNKIPYTGFYVGGQVGSTHFQDACSSFAKNCDENSFGYGLHAGYQFTDWFSLELGVNNYGQLKAEYLITDIAVEVVGAEFTSKFSHHFSPNFDVYTRLGIHYLNIDKSVSVTSESLVSHNVEPVIALGASYNLSRHWVLNSEYKFVDGIGDKTVDKADFHFLSVGVSYKFGKDNSRSVRLVDSSEQAYNSVTSEESEASTISINTSLLFKFDSAVIEDPSELNKIVEKFNRGVIRYIKISGHTDSVGSANYNLKLSEQRAQAVLEYLKFHGLNRDYSVKGKGEGKPIATNNTPEGRAKNRRVEITIKKLNYPKVEKNKQ